MRILAESSWRTYSLLIEDYETLKQYYSQYVPVKGTSGKYCIHSSLVYPRYKIKASFELYNQANPVHKKSIAKNESYADYVVMPCKEILNILEKAITSRTKDSEFLDQPVRVFRYMSTKDLHLLKVAVNHRNSDHFSKPLIDFSEFSASMEDLKERLTIDKTEFIKQLLGSDSASKRLAMETMTNYDTKRSLIALLYLFSGTSFRMHEYYTSTAFKAFRGKIGELTGCEPEYWSGMGFTRIYKTLVHNDVVKDITLTRSEYAFIREIMHKDCMEAAENSGVTLNLKPEDVILAFDESRIIPDEEVENEDAIRQKALLEDTPDTYLLVDDTA